MGQNADPMLPGSLRKAIEDLLSQTLAPEAVIVSALPLGGGDINHALALETSCGRIFVKYNHATRFPGMFEAEARGLSILAAACTIDTPEIIGFGSAGENSFLALKYIDTGKRMSGFMQQFGQRLAMLHQNSREYFGLDHDNYIGSLPQTNTPSVSWTDFFIQCRLQPMLGIARKNGLLSRDDESAFEHLYNRLRQIVPEESPSLLHGDLWGGNYMCGPAGTPVLIDPAVYYGHREADLSMTRLFGGFDQDFYQAYHAHYPLQPGWEQRIEIFNLYPLLVHVNLFGAGYVGSVKQIIRKF